VLWLITFIESFATILVERGVYFFTHDRLGFSDTQNLWLALAFGLAYAVGAMLSRRLSALFGSERTAVAAAIISQAMVHCAMTNWSLTAPVVVIGSVALGMLNGAKWPVIESFVSAGRTSAAALRAVGRFNVSWAAAVPPALAVAGPIIDSRWPAGLFALAAAINLASLAMLVGVPRRPAHIPHDHPDRPAAAQLGRYASLLWTARSLMLGSYAFMWILAAVMPRIFNDLGRPTSEAAALSGLLDVVRVTAFVLLQRYRGWHNRFWPLAASLAALPVGFAMIMFGADLPTVLAGELIFGLAAGMVYFASLYYAMVVKNASIEAGGAHEGLIGLGFAAGPAAGLVGMALMPLLGGSYVLGVVAGVGPMYALCMAAAVMPLVRRNNRGRRRA